jgi:hypothetical protein
MTMQTQNQNVADLLVQRSIKAGVLSRSEHDVKHLNVMLTFHLRALQFATGKRLRIVNEDGTPWEPLG